MKSLIFTLMFLLILSSCKKEEQAIKPKSVKVESTKEKQTKKKSSVSKPSIDIFAAIDAENVEEIKKNIEFDKEIVSKLDASGDFFPIHYAAFHGKLNALKAIGEYCDLNIKCPDNTGITALIYAADKGHLDIVKYLVEKGADVNIIFGEIKNGKMINSGYTALYASCIDDNWEITKFLLKNGADHKIICKMPLDPTTAYDRAIKNGSNGSKGWLDKYNAKTATELMKK